MGPRGALTREDETVKKKAFSTLGLVIGVLVVLILACNLPVQGTDPPVNDLVQDAVVNTSIALTVEAVRGSEGTQAVPEPASGDGSPESTEQRPTETPRPSLTSTPTLPPTSTWTPTPEQPRVRLSENTNCRTGPGSVYDLLSILYSGDEAEAVAQDPTGDFWYIRDPDAPSGACWLWGRYATPLGDTASLPVFTPPPTPTYTPTWTPTAPALDYQVTYDGKANCGGGDYMLNYRITNIGSVTLESWRTSGTDHTGGTLPGFRTGNTFQEIGGFCLVTSSQQALNPGESHFVMAPFQGDPAGHDLTIKVQICSQNGLVGNCGTEYYRHTP